MPPKPKRDISSPGSTKKSALNAKKPRKTLDFSDGASKDDARPQNSEDMEILSGNVTNESLGRDDTAPLWFAKFEQRFEELIRITRSEINDMKEGLEFIIETTKSSFDKVNDEVSQLWDKIDDLENRNRRNNLVLYNVPENSESNPYNCIDFLMTLSQDFIKLNPQQIPAFERAHRTPTGPARVNEQHPRPIHILFPSFQDKVALRKAAIAVFKELKFKDRKLYIQDDISARVQKKRKDLLPVLKKLKEEGKHPFFSYPATLKFWDNGHLKVFKRE